MLARKRVRFSDCVSTFEDDPNSNNYKSGSKAGGVGGELRLPLSTLALLMRKCHVRLTRCDNSDVRAAKPCRRASEPAKSNKLEKVGKEERKSVESLFSLFSLKREVADLEEKENWEVDEVDDVDTNLLVPQIKIDAVEEDDRLIKPSLSQLAKRRFNTTPCHVKLSRCDEVVRGIKPEMRLKQEVSSLRNCQVLLFRCDTSKVKDKGVGRRTIGRKRNSRKSELVPCYLCEKLVASSYMYSHLNKHTGEKPYKCPVCPETAFLFPRDLKRHMMKHENVGVGTASMETTCSNKRSQSPSNHTKYLSGRPHLSMKLEQGPEAPAQKNSRSTSKNTKKHTCDICERSFAAKHCLIYHVRAIHTGERPYSCPKCEMKFYDSYHRDFHVKKKH